MRKTICTILAAAACAAAALAQSGEEQARRQARSVHLNWKGIVPGATEIKGAVKVTQEQTNTYYAVIVFDNGYMGIQNVNGKHVGIFSVWDPGSNSDHPDDVAEDLRAKVLYSAPQVQVSRFGGEGTGAKTMFPLEWKVGEKVHCRVETTRDGDKRTMVTGYIGDGKTEWKIASISYLSHGRAPGFKGAYCFVEDFWRNVHSKSLVRRAEFTGFASRLSPKDPFTPVDQAFFTGDSNTLMTIDAGPVPGGGFLQTGGDTRNVTCPLWGVFDVK